MEINSCHEKWMQEALKEAQKAFDQEEVPIGAVLVKKGQIIARAHNEREKSQNPLDHAEMRVLHEASAKLGNWRLEETTLYVTLEPCPMCLGAMLQARIPHLVYGCIDPKRGDFILQKQNNNWEFPSLDQIKILSGNNHQISIEGGILPNQCQELLKRFFFERR